MVSESIHMYVPPFIVSKKIPTVEDIFDYFCPPLGLETERLRMTLLGVENPVVLPTLKRKNSAI